MTMQLRYLSSFVLTLLLIQSVAFSRTWHVTKDGSGDFTAIQPALDMSAPGDTVLIGPGRFTESEEVVVPGWTEDICATVWNDSISIIGSGVDITIIGPESTSKQLTPRPKGIYGAFGVLNGRIENLTIENLRDGIYWSGGVDVNNCKVQSGVVALALWPSSEVSIRQTVCTGNTDYGVVAFAPGEGVIIADCQFDESELGISIARVGDVEISNCRFNNHIVGVQYDGSWGSMFDCTFSGIENCSLSAITSRVILMRNVMASSGQPLYLSSGSDVSGSGNIVGGGSYATLRVVGSSVSLNDGHILNAGGWSVRTTTFPGSPEITVDFTNNYWGTTEADSISAWILDGLDDPDIEAIVDFEPFSPVPLPTEQKSMSDIKRMFR